MGPMRHLGGFILSGLILLPSIRWTPDPGMMHPILYLFIVSPFVALGVQLRLTHAARRVLLLSIPYLACHAILTGTYLFTDPHPQEFGHLGLVLLPFYKSIVAPPVSGVLVLLTETLAKRAFAAAGDRSG